MSDLVFDIPILKEEIARYLFPRHLLRCILVSRYWNTLFFPSLWREIELTYFNTFLPWNETPKILIRNAKYIQSIILDGRLPTPSDFPDFPNLRSIKFLAIDIASKLQIFWHFFSTSPALRKIVIKGITLADKKTTVDKDDMDKLLGVLKGVPMLNHLELSFAALIDGTGENIKDIIVANRHLDTLYIETNSIFTMDIPDQLLLERSQNLKEAVYKLENIKIKNLRIEVVNKDLEAALLIPLVERCENLEDLQIISRHYRSDLRQVADILVDKKLKRFRFDGNWTDGQDLDVLLARIGADNNIAGNNESRCRITVLKLGHNQFTTVFPRIVTTHYADTLTSLDLQGLSLLKSLVIILNGLPNLRSFISSYTGGPSEEEVEDICQLPFVCLNLRILYIAFNFIQYMTGKQYQMYWKGSSNDKLMDFMFSQIGRLSKLQEFGIGSDAHCLTQRNGYLEHLSNLKNLTTLCLERYASGRSALSVMNVNWMMDHWPKLDTIHFSQHFISGWNPYGSSKPPRNPTIDALRQRKPNIYLTIAESKYSPCTRFPI
ncbi:hypothetical protein BGZ76_003953 [Entomortierella beljakovae]|nr:hypothetical protein BGZ76_003953 [Entomortierella beljakovae]